jgi:hypothetical protein
MALRAKKMLFFETFEASRLCGEAESPPPPARTNAL